MTHLRGDLPPIDLDDIEMRWASQWGESDDGQRRAWRDDIARLIDEVRSLRATPEPPDLSAALVELPPTVEATPFSPWFTASCVQRCGLWAGRGGPDEMAVVAEAVAHVLDEGHETAVARESSVHYHAALAQQPETGR